MPQSEKTTQILDAVRAFFLASRVPFRESVAMLVLIEIFHASDSQKTLMSLLMQGGLFLSIPAVAWVRRRQMYVSDALGRTYLFAAILAVLLSFTEAVYPFILGSGALLLASIAVHALLIQIYAGYASSHLGRRAVTTFVAETLGAVVFGVIVTLIIGDAIGRYPLILLLLALTHVIAAVVSFQLPKLVVPQLEVRKRFGTASLSLLREDHLFRRIIIAWFLLGFSGHWLMMYRTNLFVEERFGFSYSTEQVLFLIVILPSIVEVVSSFVFSRLFDGMNFLKLRLGLNIIHGLYLVLVLFGTGWTAHLLGMICFGLHRGGGKWNLWVTRISSTERVADYMAVHGFFTGVRMILGPTVGLFALARFGPSLCGYVAVALVVVSSLLFVSVVSHPRVVAEA